ncbi:hypothetical protein BX666DRAFT_2027814 [Dichotomocladium elegans]|nr:hypothetical protein BX666DRAFT_2027814 [Dichotomocladium elegans]
MSSGRQSVVYGIVKDLKPLSRSMKGKQDYFIILTLLDPTVSKFGKGLGTNLFHRSEEAFPKDIAPGDLIMIRNVNINVYASTRQAVSISGRTQWLVLDCESFTPKRTPAMEVELTEDETAVLKMMQDWYLKSEWYASCDKVAIQIKQNPYLRRTEEVGGAGCPEYFDFMGMVVTYKPVSPMHPKRAELLLTDFTRNKKPISGFEAEGTIDPSLLIQCTLWDQNATMCPQLKYGDYVYIRNTKWKTSRLGYFEIVVHGEPGRPPKIRKIENPNDPRLADIKGRADKFVKQKSTKEATSDKITIDNVYTVLHKQEPQVKRFAVRAFVVDFKPHDPREWIRKWCRGCDVVDSCDADSCAQCGKPFTKYTFVASFLIEDAYHQNLILYIYGDDAQRMFSDLGNISFDDDYVQKLSERLRQLPSRARPEKLYLDFGGKSYNVPGRGRCFRLDETEFMFC